MNPLQARNGQILEGSRIVYSDDMYEKHMLKDQVLICVLGTMSSLPIDSLFET